MPDADKDAGTERVYPRTPRTPNRHLDRRWRVEFNNLVYDGGGTASRKWGYRTRLGARLAAWWHYHVASWGGGPVTITDTRILPPAVGREARP
jgi:hypothetical protein